MTTVGDAHAKRASALRERQGEGDRPSGWTAASADLIAAICGWKDFTGK